MNDWLFNLHDYFSRAEPFVLATVTSYHGVSPELPGVYVFYSETSETSTVESTYRSEKMCTAAKRILQNKTSHSTELLALGNVADANNGHCIVFYEYFGAQSYPDWLTTLRDRQRIGISSVLHRKFSKESNQNQIETLIFDDSTTIAAFKNQLTHCQLTTTQSNYELERLIENQNISLTILGSHTVAKAIRQQAENLPIDITAIETAEIEMVRADQNNRNDSAGNDKAAEIDQQIDQQVDLSRLLTQKTVQAKPETTDQKATRRNYIVIMTGDHELDYMCCEAALTHDAIYFVGCIGSEKKTRLFISRLRQQGLSSDQISRLSMPVGMREISGKQTTVVAASVIAQLMALHQW